jgi:hypothetical protein
MRQSIFRRPNIQLCNQSNLVKTGAGASLTKCLLNHGHGSASHAKSTSRWRRPIATEEEESNHATWIELFFNLVFVIVIAELSHMLNSISFQFGALFVLRWWAWVAICLIHPCCCTSLVDFN